MKTRCPHCDTLYEIDEATLIKADHAAVCCRCHQVFLAKPADDNYRPPPVTNKDQENPGAKEAEQGDSAPEIDKIALEIEALAREVEKQQQLDDEWDFIDQLKTQQQPQLEPQDSENPDTVESIPLVLNPAGNQPTASQFNLVSVMLALVLALLAAAQLAWQNRASLAQQPWGKAVVIPACSILDCKLSESSESSQFDIIQRDLRSVQNRPNTLELSLTFTNKSKTDQPLPDLLVSLFDHRDTLVAQRRFTPAEYLHLDNPKQLTSLPGEIQEVRLLMQEPSTGSAGFKLEFL